MKSFAPLLQRLRRPSDPGRRRTRPARVGRVIELAAFALVLPLLGRWLSPGDPLGLAHGFAWAAVGPVVFAARYGLAQGACCAVLAGAAMVLAPGSTSVVLAVGTLVLSIVVGDAASAWRRRSLRAEAENGYLKHRLREFSNDYHVLKVSHGQLEEFMAGQRLSLREALQRLRPALATRDGSLEDGAELMAVFAQFCSVQVAGLYAMKSATLIDATPLALQGDMGELPLFDPLLRMALSERKLASVQLDAGAGDRQHSELLAVVPIMDSRDVLHGVLAVRDMHFMAFQQENLNVMALLAASIGDRIARSGGFDDNPGERFVNELDTSLRFVSTHSVDASLLVLGFPERAHRDAIMDLVCDSVRSLDAVWRLPSRDGSCRLAVLLPLVGRPGSNAWLARVDRHVRERFGVSLAERLGSARCLALDASHDRGKCLEFLDGEGGEMMASIGSDDGLPGQRHVA